MLRLFLFLALGSFMVGTQPDLRARAMPHAQRLLDPVYEWSARWRLGEISKALEAELARGRPLPGPDALPDFVRGYFPGTDSHLDPWGTPFFLQHSRLDVRVASAGRDGKPRTSDDLLSRPVRPPSR